MNLILILIHSYVPKGWFKKLALDLMDGLLQNAPSGYEQWQLLSLADKSGTREVNGNWLRYSSSQQILIILFYVGISEEYSKLYRVFKILRAASLPRELLRFLHPRLNHLIQRISLISISLSLIQSWPRSSTAATTLRWPFRSGTSVCH